jgi:hypothetical protein
MLGLSSQGGLYCEAALFAQSITSTRLRRFAFAAKALYINRNASRAGQPLHSSPPYAGPMLMRKIAGFGP